MRIELLHCHSPEAAYRTAVELRRQLPGSALVEQRGMLVAICIPVPLRARIAAAINCLRGLALMARAAFTAQRRARVI